jgi:hypothetical protein
MSHDGFHEKTEAKRQFSGVAQMVVLLWEGRKYFIFQWGLTDSLSAAALFFLVSYRFEPTAKQ